MIIDLIIYFKNEDLYQKFKSIKKVLIFLFSNYLKLPSNFDHHLLGHLLLLNLFQNTNKFDCEVASHEEFDILDAVIFK